MAARKKVNKYPGVYYREGKRIGKKGTEKIYYVVYKKDGQTKEIKAGRQYADNMTPAKASRLRGEYIEGRRKTPREVAAERAARWDMNKLWEFFKEQKKTKKSFKDDKYRWNLHIKPTLGKKPIENIVTLDIDRIRLRMMKTHAPATVRQVITLIRSMIRLGALKGNYQMPDISRLSFEFPKVNNQSTEDLSPEQLEKLMNILDNHHNIQVANLMKLALFTGMRRSELFRLQWKHINLNRGVILLVDPKSGPDQKIPLNDAARELLLEHEQTGSDYVFPGKNGGQRKDCKKPAADIRDAAGLPKTFRPLHGLRHTYASMLASSGKVDMYVLQKLMTHKSPQMTQRYAHLRDEALKSAANVASRIFKKKERA